MARVVLENVVKRFGDVVAVNQVSLTIQDGEFVVLVGPSGCGKTTTLNMIAGLIELSDGNIYIGDRLVNDLDPKDRDIAMVFQNYALYPTKTVWGNMAFPLQMRGAAKADIAARVERAAASLGIKHLLGRRPRELSGGQQQRVALGRALVRDPQVFLMDEPLSNLDAKLRVQMRAELKRMHQELRSTIVYVTHDQLEAMTMADRIVIMRDGVVQQAGSPDEIYRRPVNTFVGGFIGSPSMNFLTGQLTVENETTFVDGNGWRLALSPANSRRAAHSTGEIVLGVRHGQVRLGTQATPNALQGSIYTVEPTGDVTYVHVRLAEHLLVASTGPTFAGRADEPIWLEVDQERLHLFDGESQLALTAE
jgi:multiple sugar transport system ATP-binding protein